jgi:hypothetical protein
LTVGLYAYAGIALATGTVAAIAMATAKPPQRFEIGEAVLFGYAIGAAWLVILVAYVLDRVKERKRRARQ